MKIHVFVLGVALILGLALTACGQEAPTPTPAPAATPTATRVPPAPTSTRVPAASPTATPSAQTGTVQVRVTDAPPEGVSKVLVTASKIEAQISGAAGEAGWTTIIEAPPVFDLVAVTGLEDVLGQNTLATGSYGQVRLAVTKVVVTIQGKDQEAEVPGDKLRVVGGFQVAAGQTTVLTLDFDADKSVVLAGPRVQFEPVVKLLAKAPSGQPESPKKGVVVPINALGDSGQTGQAVLASLGGKTEVTITIKAGAAGVAQPAHIHDKDCTTPGAVKYPLTSVVDGKSTTLIDASLATLQASAFAVRVHKSVPEIATYVACGEIPLATTAVPTATAPALTKATVKVTAHPRFGNILTDISGRTLYLWSRDERNKSTCSGGCAQAWPPLLTDGDPTAGNGVTQATLGVIQRTDGGTQVVYNGKPLYYYAQDMAAGDANGQNVGTTWFVLSGDGSPIQDAALIKTGSNPALGTIIADRSGRTLYLYTRDEANLSNCSGGCARAWPPVLTIGNPTVGEGAAANLLGTIKRTEGSTQVTYKGHPLYYYNLDDKPGDIIGQNVGAVWYVVSAAGESITNLATMSINLKPQEGQTQFGTAVLTAKGSQTEVVITLSAGPAGAAVEQPAHIHNGSCPAVGGVTFPLTNVKDGKSTSLVNTSLESLRTGGFAINVHKSAPEAAVYTACGDIPGPTISVNLRPQQGQTQSGTARLTAKGSQTEVVINLSAGPAGVAQPAHIHDKDCTTPGAVKYPLTSVVDGKSTTLIDTPLATLQASAFAVRVHKSVPEIATYVACGEIPMTSGASASPTGTTPSTPSAGAESDYGY